MKRNPIVRALCERARRPEAIKILAGLLLMAPAGLMTMRGGELGVRSTPVPAVLAPIEVTAPSTPVAVASLAKQRSEEHTSELQSRLHLVCRLLLEKKKKKIHNTSPKKPKVTARRYSTSA